MRVETGDGGDGREPIAPLRRRVLVVATDPGVATTIRRSLRAEYDVDLAMSGSACLASIAAGERYDAILLDVAIDEMSVPDLFAELSRVRPEAGRGIGFLSGGATTRESSAFLQALPGRSIPKATDPRDFVDFVGDLMR